MSKIQGCVVSGKKHNVLSHTAFFRNGSLLNQGEKVNVVANFHVLSRGGDEPNFIFLAVRDDARNVEKCRAQ